MKTKWNLDKSHSEIKFKAKHLMISTVSVGFDNYDLEVETEGDDFSTAKANYKAEIKSIKTGDAQRDGHLLTNDFFNAELFPEMKFQSTESTKTGDKSFEISGLLTIRDVTKPITLKAEVEGIVKDPWGNTKAALQISGKINRKDYGLSFHVLTDTGSLLVSDEIKLEAELELTKEVVEVEKLSAA
jgi:polyisoprenoid-binding protein YceI